MCALRLVLHCISVSCIQHTVRPLHARFHGLPHTMPCSAPHLPAHGCSYSACWAYLQNRCCSSMHSVFSSSSSSTLACPNITRARQCALPKQLPLPCVHTCSILRWPTCWKTTAAMPEGSADKPAARLRTLAFVLWRLYELDAPTCMQHFQNPARPRSAAAALRHASTAASAPAQHPTLALFIKIPSPQSPGGTGSRGR